MQQHLFLALSNQAAGREEHFHEWYDRHHLQDVVDFCPGFVTGHRYWAAAKQAGDQSLPWSSLAIYLLETDDVGRLHEQVLENVCRFTPSDGVFDPDHAAWVYTPMSAGPVEAANDSAVVLVFSDTPLPALGFTALERAGAQRKGETPTWRYMTLIHDQDEMESRARDLVGLPDVAAVWRFDPRGMTVRTRSAGSQSSID
jgi:hypothetical protein